MKQILMGAAAVVAMCAAMMPVHAKAQQAEPNQGYIEVTGRAEMEIEPDEFYLQIVINERDSKGKISVAEQQHEMLAVLRKLHVDVDRQLRVVNLSSEFYKRNNSVATAKYQLQLATASEVTKVCRALDAMGISDVSIARVTHSKIDSLKQEVRLAAVRNAKASATAMAEAIGQRAGKCFYIWDANNDIVPQRYNNKMMARATALEMVDDIEAEVDEEPLEFRKLKLQYSVQTRFVLE